MKIRILDGLAYLEGKGALTDRPNIVVMALPAELRERFRYDGHYQVQIIERGGIGVSIEFFGILEADDLPARYCKSSGAICKNLLRAAGIRKREQEGTKTYRVSVRRIK